MRIVLILGEHRHDTERADVHEGVRDRVNRDGGDGIVAHRRHRDHHVADVGDAGVGEHPLQVALHDGDDIADKHRENRERGHHLHPRHMRKDRRESDEESHQCDQGCCFRRDRKPAGDRSRRALIDVRRPWMEWRERELESESRHQKHECDRQQMIR